MVADKISKAISSEPLHSTEMGNMRLQNTKGETNIKGGTKVNSDLNSWKRKNSVVQLGDC